MLLNLTGDSEGSRLFKNWRESEIKECDRIRFKSWAEYYLMKERIRIFPI